jgi:hypothetical protein
MDISWTLEVVKCVSAEVKKKLVAKLCALSIVNMDLLRMQVDVKFVPVPQ